MISEMRRPQQAMRAAYTLQGFATTFYAIFAGVLYGFIGSGVASPAFSSLSPKWMKAAYGIALPNFLIAGSLYSHTAAKLIFVRVFRDTNHIHSHTTLGWLTWISLIVVINVAAFVLAVGVPIFNYLIGIAASLFAAWYTYGIAGFFGIHMMYHDEDGWKNLARHPVQTTLSILTILAGAFICVAGTYVTIKGIVDAYDSGQVPAAFAC